MLLRRRHAAHRVPQVLPRVDLSSELAAGLIDVVVSTPGALVSLITGNVSSSDGSQPVAELIDSPGRGRRTTASTGTCYARIPMPQWTAAANAAPGFTLWAWGRVDDAVSLNPSGFTARQVIGFFHNRTSNHGISIGLRTTDGEICASQSMHTAKASGALSVGTAVPFHAFAVTAPSTGIFLDAPLVGTSTSSSTYTMTSSTADNPGIETGYSFGPVTRHGDKTLFAGALWSRVLSAEERLRIAIDPRILFVQPRVFVPMSAGALPALTLQADGSVVHKPAPSGSDAKLYLTSAGVVVAKTSPGAGDRRISIDSGAWTAH